MLARGILQAAHFDVTILDAALRLVGAYIVIRVGVLLFAASLGNKSWMQNLENRLTLFIWLAFAADYLGWLDPIIPGLDSIGIASGKTRITVWSVLKLLFTLTLFVLVAAWISRWIDRRLKKLHTLAPSTRIGLAKFANAFLIGLSILVGLNTAGVDLTALTVLTGAIGLGLGFGLQSIASNFVSGFVLLMDRSIKPGDVISLSGQSGTSTENFGWVQELRGRYVVVRDRDGIEMLVPNQQLISNAVINWSYTDPRIRLKLPVRVSYQDDPELALKILLDACEGQRRVLRDPPPVSRLMQFGDPRHRARAALLDIRSAGRREQRALRGQPHHLAPCSRRTTSPSRSRSARSACATRRPISTEERARAAHRLRGHRHPRRGARVEVHPLLGSRRPERQQGRERRAAAVLAAAEHQPAGCRPRIGCAVSRDRGSIDDGSILITRPQRAQPGTEPPRRARAPRRPDPRRADRAQDPQEDPAHAGLQGAAHRIEEAPRRHQAAERSGRALGLGLGYWPKVTCRMSCRSCSDSTSCASAATPSSGSPNSIVAVLAPWQSRCAGAADR